MKHLHALHAVTMAVLLLGLPLASINPAFAHAALVSAVPAVDATVSAPSPTELRLNFSEPLELAFTKVVVKAPDGEVVGLGTLALDPSDAKTLVVPLTAPLPKGAVTVDWTAVASDGHKSKGSYTLTIAN